MNGRMPLCINCLRKCKDDNTFCSKPIKDLKINLYQLHNWEEPPISGSSGSGTIFFSHCNLSCVFCQNYKISQQAFGRQLTIEELYDACIELKDAGAHNINFVTPTPQQENIRKVLIMLKKNGFELPIVWNCGGYETLEAIKDLNGLVDIYLPDFKYSDNDLAVKYSSAPNYYPNIESVLKEMRSQVADTFDGNGLMKTGLIIRHLVLPSAIQNSFGVFDSIKKLLGKDVHISLMSQYCPVYKASEFKEINRVLSPEEYNAVLEYVQELGFENGFIQDMDSASTDYTPVFLA